MDASTISTAVTEVQGVGDLILKELETYAPGTAVPDAAAGVILDLASQLAVKGLNAWSAASGIAITPENIMKLKVDDTPLVVPPAPPSVTNS